ncbi:hypothetical protein [Helicobacter turcicus]|uniref:Uncharacterized protein n=1 Tax=Helicobacter turcicus TaxID=2867412 RepID=A0ABS7JPJ5_9HELI|nr:hypothetical protein [Helicobacter turcicus]MBX7491282.1 hypothetical protein [Helicobacter turcicus]MBX7546079.1 hypothetical protein [Helicobacter turcicus]
MANLENNLSGFINDIEETIGYQILPAHSDFTKKQREVILRVIKEKLEEAEAEIYDELEGL